MKKYLIYIIIFFIFMLSCSVGYALFSQELNISGTTSINTNINNTCDITKIDNNNLTVSVKNSFFSTTAGEIQITITNNNNTNYEYFTILANLPENLTISSAYNGTYTITDNIIQIHGPNYAHNLNSSASFTYFIQWRTTSNYIGLINEDVMAFGNDILSTYTCTNGKWYLNGSLINSEVKQDLHLSTLTVNNYNLLPTFNSKVYKYSINVPNNINSVNIGATLVDPSATITGIGTKSLELGNNTSNIVITSRNNETLTYILDIYRVHSGVGAQQNFVNNNIVASYIIDYSSGNVYQFSLTITNNTTSDISNWDVAFDIGNGNIDAIWNSIYTSYDSNSGLMLISSTTATDDSLKTIEANTSINIKGQIQAEYEPKIVKLNY